MDKHAPSKRDDAGAFIKRDHMYVHESFIMPGEEEEERYVIDATEATSPHVIYAYEASSPYVPGQENEELWTSLRLADGQIESYDHVEIACPFVAKKVETACSFPVVSSVGMLHSHHLDVER